MKLANCPFCGGNAEISQESDSLWYVGCSNLPCPVSAYLLYEDKEKAIKEWNTRTPNEDNK